MIKVLVGNMFETEMTTLVNTVNCVGVMGKGIAQAAKKKYPQMFEDYVRRCRSNQVNLGEPYHYSDLTGVSIVNFPTKGHWKSTTRVSDVQAGLKFFVDHVREWGIESVAFPPLGCGNGGLEWKQVGPLMYSSLKDLDILVEIYAPFGTPEGQLKEDFLCAEQQIGFLTKGRLRGSLRPEWAVVIEVLHRLRRQPYSKPIGRKLFGSICHIMTNLGLDMGFQTIRGSSALPTTELRETINVLANNNWIVERRRGSTTTLEVGFQFEDDRRKFLGIINSFEGKIAKTVDLFSRIRNVRQAEDVATVVSSVQALKRTYGSVNVSEQDLFDYIANSARKSMEHEERRFELAETIRNLEMLGWVKLRFSESLQIVGRQSDLDDLFANQHSAL